ncbi:MAG: DNRLRE domain-containing protein [Actinomycetota bacterium]|nr:MAG: DNRLRE domain-containing protein [Actinomycetota bacterium]
MAGLSSSSHGRGSRRLALVVPVTAGALVAGLLTVPASFGVGVSAADDSGLRSMADASGHSRQDSAPDRAAASILARHQKSRVEVESARTERLRLFANPDGTYTAEGWSGPQSVRQADGSWADIDTTLAVDGESVRPRMAAADITLSGGGSGPLAKVKLPGDPASLDALAAVASSSTPQRTPGIAQPAASVTDRVTGASVGVAVSWPTDLPAPVLAGSTATYSSVAPGQDLRVEVLPTGFRTLLDLTTRPAVVPDGGVTVTLPVTADGLTLVDDPRHGGVAAQDGKGRVITRIPAAAVWDAGVNEQSGDPTHAMTLPTTLVKTAAGQALALTVPKAFFDDPGLQFPVTIDPTSTLSASEDTFVGSGAPTTNFSTSTDLRIGTFDGGTTIGRSYLKFPLDTMAEFFDDRTVVTSASLGLWNWWSQTCTAFAAEVRRPTSTWSGSSVTWNTKPTQSAAVATVTEAHRNDSGGGCAEGWLGGASGFNVTSLVQDYASGTYPDYGFAVTASESNSNGWKKFYSSDYGTAGQRPKLTVTFGHKPDTPDGPAVGGMQHDLWINTTTPTFTNTVNDIDGGTVRAQYTVTNDAGTSTVGTVDSSYVSVGSQATATLTGASFTAGTQYRVKVAAYDGANTSVTSATVPFKVDTTAPTAPSVSCSGFPVNTWSATGSGAMTCSASSTDATAGVDAFTWTLDGDAMPTADATSGSGTLDVSPEPLERGWHTLVVTALDNAGNASSATTYGFGVDGAGFSQPMAWLASPNEVNLVVDSPTSYGAARMEYYDDTLTTPAWVAVPDADLVTAAGGSVTQPVTLTTSGSVASNAVVRWKLNQTFSFDRVVQLRGCLLVTSGSGSCSDYTPTRYVSFDRVGTSGAAQQVGPASVSLATGDAAVSATDFSLPYWAGDLSLSRVHHSSRGNVDGPFGKGWDTSLPATYQPWTRLVDNSTFALLYAGDGSSVGFHPTSARGTYPTQFVADDGNELLTLTQTNSTTWTVTDPADSVVTFTHNHTGDGSLTNADVSVPTGSTSPGSGSTGAEFDGSGQVTRIAAPLPPGVSAGSCTDAGFATWVAGCADLKFTYSSGNISKITYRMWDPTASTGNERKAIDVACYLYDGSGHLTDAWNPGEESTTPDSCGATNTLGTSYGYTSDRITSITPAGLAAWTLTYGASGPDTGKLTSVARQHTGGSFGTGTETTKVLYDVNIGAASSSSDDTHPDLTATAAAAWAQESIPVSGVAVVLPAYAATVTTAALKGATVYGLDGYGLVLNTAQFSGVGQAGWKTSTYTYDTEGEATRTLSAENRDRALNVGSAWTTMLTSAGMAGMSTAERAKALSFTRVFAPESTLVTDTYGPLAWAAFSDGSKGYARAHTHYEYGTIDYPTTTPSAGTWDSTAPLYSVKSTTTRASRSPLAAAVNEDTGWTSETRYAYALVGTATTDAEKAGWTLGAPMKVTTENGSADVPRVTTFDPTTGQVLEQRQPSTAGTSADPGTRVTTYYGTGTHNTSTCTSTAWYGLPCKTAPGAQPGSGGDLPVTTTTYDTFRRPVTTTSTVPSGGVSDTVTTTTYANSGYSGQPSQTQITDGTTTLTTTPTYSSTTGLPTSVAQGTSTIDTGYDDFGRVLTNVEKTSGTEKSRTTTVFDAYGRTDTVTTLADGSTAVSTLDYTYDGGSERRGLPTSVDQTVPTATGTFAAVYNAAGQVTQQTLGDNSRQTYFYGNTGQTLETKYIRDTGTWLQQWADSDIIGRWRGLTGFGFDGKRSYDYDQAGRLTQVKDQTDGGCYTRTWAFAGSAGLNSNRTGSAVYAPIPAGCSTSGTQVESQTFAYDAADRLQSSGTATGVAYDAWGRTTTLPQALTSTQSSGNVTLTYQPNDMVKSMTQGATGTSWVLDAGNRLACQRTKPTVTSDATACGATLTSGVIDTTNHYPGLGSDSPSWTLVRAGAGSPTNTRSAYLPGLTRNLITQATTTASATTIAFQIVDLHGDVIRTVDPFTGTLTATTYTDPYGFVRGSSGAPTTGPRYSYLGGAQRANDGLAGLTLMGARIYAPVLGRFLSVDQVYGGNESPYGYPADPVGSSDLTGRCNQSTWACISSILTSYEPWPTTGPSRGNPFLVYLRKKSEWTYLNVQGTRVRYGLGGGDHCSASPDTGPYFDFTLACDTHDLGYELLRYFRVGGGVRQSVDGLFHGDMMNDCNDRSLLWRNLCYNTANSYYGAVLFNTIRQGFGTPP